MTPEEIFTKNLDIVLAECSLYVYKYGDGFVEVNLKYKVGYAGEPALELSGPSLHDVISQAVDKIKGTPDAAP